MKIALNLKRFLDVAKLPCISNGAWTKESKDLWVGADRELRALLAVARAAKRMCQFSIPPRNWHTPGEDARRATFQALARLERVSRETP